MSKFKNYFYKYNKLGGVEVSILTAKIRSVIFIDADHPSKINVLKKHGYDNECGRNRVFSVIIKGTEIAFIIHVIKEINILKYTEQYCVLI